VIRKQVVIRKVLRKRKPKLLVALLLPVAEEAQLAVTVLLVEVVMERKVDLVVEGVAVEGAVVAVVVPPATRRSGLQ
jgi:Fe2+ transport system protein B